MSDIDHIIYNNNWWKLLLKKLRVRPETATIRKRRRKIKRTKMEIATLFALHTNAVSLSNHPARIDFCEKNEIPTKKKHEYFD